MRYPGALDISYIIELSLYLKDPSKYCEPAIPTHHKTGAQLINSPVNKLKKKLPIKEKQKIETGAFGKLKKFSTKSRWNSSRISDRGESESNIIVGYTLDVIIIVLYVYLVSAKVLMGMKFHLFFLIC